MKADCDFDTWGAEDGTCTLPCNVTRANTCISLPSIGTSVFKMMFKYMYVCKKIKPNTCAYNKLLGYR